MQPSSMKHSSSPGQITLHCFCISVGENNSSDSKRKKLEGPGCSVATDLRVLYFPPTDDLQDLVGYDIKLVLIV